MTTASLPRRAAWGAMLLGAIAVSGYALASATAPGLRSPFVQDLFADRALRAFGHLSAGGIALLAGAFQFSTRLRAGRPAVHRLLGKVYLASVLVGGIAAVALAPVSSGGITAHWGFGMLGVLWLLSSGIAYRCILSRDIAGHRVWMIRSYALCLAAVTLRIYLPIGFALGIPFPEFYPAISWLCWVPNVVVAEWLVIRSRVAPVAS